MLGKTRGDALQTLFMAGSNREMRRWRTIEYCRVQQTAGEMGRSATC